LTKWRYAPSTELVPEALISLSCVPVANNRPSATMAMLWAIASTSETMCVERMTIAPRKFVAQIERASGSAHGQLVHD
jgi:hypothetical protein